MSSDEIIDAHAERLRLDPGYQAIWHKVQTAKPEHRLLVAMLLWANDAMILRTLCGKHALREDAFAAWLLDLAKQEWGNSEEEMREWFRRESVCAPEWRDLPPQSG